MPYYVTYKDYSGKHPEGHRVLVDYEFSAMELVGDHVQSIEVEDDGKTFCFERLSTPEWTGSTSLSVNFKLTVRFADAKEEKEEELLRDD